MLYKLICWLTRLRQHREFRRRIAEAEAAVAARHAERMAGMAEHQRDLNETLDKEIAEAESGEDISRALLKYLRG